MIQSLILLFSSVGAHDPDYWHTQIMWGQIGLCVWLSYEIFKRVHSLPALAFLYFSCFGVWSVFAPAKFSLNATQSLQANFDAASARSLLFLLFIILPFIIVDKKGLKNWHKAFHLFALINAVWMIFNYFKRGSAIGFNGSDSVDGSMICLMLPWFFSKKDWLCISLISLALILTKSSTVYGLLCLEFLIWFIAYAEVSVWKYLSLLIGAIAGASFFQLWIGKEFLNDNGRGEIHKITWKVFKSIPENWMNYAFGLGSGTFYTIMPLIQGMNHKFFIWLHDEPGQVLFEQGIIGLSLLFALFFFMLYKNRKSSVQFISVSSAGAASFLQPSFRYFIFALFMTFLCRSSFEVKNA